MENKNKEIDEMIEFFSMIENKEQTVGQVIENLIDNKIKNAEIETDKIIQKEISQNKELLKNLQNNMFQIDN